MCVCIYIYKQVTHTQLLTTHPAMLSQSPSRSCSPSQQHCFSRFFWVMMFGMEYPYGQFRSAVLVPSPPSFLCPHSPFTGRTVWDALGSVQCCSTTTKGSVFYQSCFSLKAKAQHHTWHCRGKINSASAETRSVSRKVLNFIQFILLCLSSYIH